MIEEGTTLYPTRMTTTNLYYDDEPYAYWVDVPEYNFCDWVLYKEYNNYSSVCAPNDYIVGVSYEDVMEEFRNWSYFEGMDRERLCRTFRQRSLYMTDEEAWDWEDFVDEEE